MASPNERNRNNVKAGVFVSLSLVLAVAAIISLTDIWQKFNRPTRQYTVIFDVEEGVKNLKAGGKVRVGGVDMGSVIAVTPEIAADEAMKRIAVTFELAEEVKLFGGVRVNVASALIGSDAWLEITTVGSPELPLPSAGIDGYSSPGILPTLLGSDSAKKADAMIDDAVEAVSNVKSATEDLRVLTGRIRTKDWPHWAMRINHIVDWGAEATEQLDRILDEGEGMFTSARGVIVENRDSIDSIVTNVEVTTEDMRAIMNRFRTESMDRIDRMLDSGGKAMAQAEGILDDLGKALDYWVPQFDETVADIRLTAQQIKLTAIELRRGPWKLLYRPSDDELDHELLYDSVRSFAFAAADMKSSATSVERVLAKYGADLSDTDADLFDKLTRNLLESMRSYENAQRKLLDVLQSE